MATSNSAPLYTTLTDVTSGIAMAEPPLMFGIENTGSARHRRHLIPGGNYQHRSPGDRPPVTPNRPFAVTSVNCRLGWKGDIVSSKPRRLPCAASGHWWYASNRQVYPNASFTAARRKLPGCDFRL